MSLGLSGLSSIMAREALQEHGEPMQTRALVDVLTKRGVALGGSNPVNYLSGVLSRSNDFENDRVTGWHLTAWKTALNPDTHSVLEPSSNDGPGQDGPEWSNPLLRLAAD